MPTMPKFRMNFRQEFHRENDVLDIYIYDVIQDDYFDWWTWEMVKSETSAKYFLELLNKHRDVKNINIYINSLGGSVKEGLSIYNQLKRHSAYKTVYIDGYCASIASVIAMAGDKIVMPKNTVMMVHNVWSEVAGNAKQLREEADRLDKLNVIAVESYLEKAGEKLTEEKIRALMDEESILKASECLELGLCDVHSDDEADLEKANAIFKNLDNKATGFNAMQNIFEKMSAFMNNKPEPVPQPAPVPDPVPEPEPEPQPEPEPEPKADAFDIFKKLFNKGAY